MCRVWRESLPRPPDGVVLEGGQTLLLKNKMAPEAEIRKHLYSSTTEIPVSRPAPVQVRNMPGSRYSVKHYRWFRIL